MTPKHRKELLKRTADAAARELRTLKTIRRAAPSEVERLEFIASSLESYIASENLPDSEKHKKISLGQAFGVEHKRGNQGATGKPGKHFELAKRATLLRAGGWEWAEICDQLPPDDKIHPDSLRKICDREKENVMEWFSEQVEKDAK